MAGQVWELPEFKKENISATEVLAKLLDVLPDNKTLEYVTPGMFEDVLTAIQTAVETRKAPIKRGAMNYLHGIVENQRNKLALLAKLREKGDLPGES